MNRLRVDYSARERVGDGEIGGIDCKALDGTRWVGGDSNLFDLFHPSSFSSSSSYTCTLLLILSSSPTLYCTLHCAVQCRTVQYFLLDSVPHHSVELGPQIPWNPLTRTLCPVPSPLFSSLYSAPLLALCFSSMMQTGLV
jgi:hypothetical protein